MASAAGVVEQQRLLWLAIEPPWPASSGGRLRTAALLSATAKRYAVTLVLLHGDVAADRGPFADVDWVTCNADTKGKATALAGLVARGQPPYLRHFATARQRQTVRARLQTHDYAAVVADMPYAAAALPRGNEWVSQEAPGAPGDQSSAIGPVRHRPALVVNTQNVEAEVWQAATPQVAGGRLLLALDRRFIGDWERTVLARADGVAFCSERDRTLLRKALPAGVRTAVVPNAVDTATLRPLEAPVKHSEALFLGGLTYGPNLEAAQFIVSEIAPRVATDDITVLIAGGQVSDLAAARAAQPAEQRCPNGARFLGKPADVRPAYKRSYATVAPLFSGSGTRLKVLESFAYGRPVVSTAKGVEGLAVEPNVHYLPAETAEQFATQLVALRDRDLWARLVAAGRLLVEQRYSWDVAGEAFLDLLDQSIGHR